jgi:MFS family permease
VQPHPGADARPSQERRRPAPHPRALAVRQRLLDRIVVVDLVTEEFQFARGHSPVSAGVHLLPFFGTPMFVSPIAGAVCDRIGRRPAMGVGLFLLTGGLLFVSLRGSLATGWVELVLALFVAGVGISMALPTVPTAVLSAVAPDEIGKASGINYMAQRFGAAFAIAVASAVFTAYGRLGTPATVTDGFRPALAACAIFALLAALSALAIPRPRTLNAAELESAGAAVT